MMIPHTRHTITGDDIQNVVRVLRGGFAGDTTGHITQGAIVPAFERALAGYLGVRYVVVMSSGTAALCAALGYVSGTDPGNCHVVTTPLTFLASATSILHAGMRPIFSDVDGETLLLDPDLAVQAAKEVKAAAILAVDYAGQIQPAIAYHTVIVDATHSLGTPSSLQAKRGLATCYSFHATKAITTGEGGAVATDDDAMAAYCRSFRDHGRGSADGAARTLGWNYRMTDFQAALGISQLERLDVGVRRRAEIADRYDAELHFGRYKKLPTAHHLYVFRVEARKRDSFREALAKAEVGTQVHYRLCYDHPVLHDLRTDCPTAERAAKEVVSLPLFASMTNEEVSTVIAAVKGAM